MTNTPLNPDAVRAALTWFAEAVGEVEVKHADDGTRPGDYWNGYRAAKNEIADLLAEPKLIEKATNAGLAVAQPVVNNVEELNKLPVGAVVLSEGYMARQEGEEYPGVFQKLYTGDWHRGGRSSDTHPDYFLPARVLYLPEGS